jgi:hypothetical protein
MSELEDKMGPYPMRIQVAPGSEAEYRHYRAAARRSDESIEREALAPGVSAGGSDLGIDLLGNIDEERKKRLQMRKNTPEGAMGIISPAVQSLLGKGAYNG